MLRKVFGRTAEQTVEVNDGGVTRRLPDGTVEAVTWEGLTEVRIVTTSDGPVAEDVFFVLDAGETGCVVPQSLVAEDLLDRLQALPGFDNEQMIQAMSSASDAQFVCWRRPASDSP